jgi:hypothetical protein
MPPHATSSENVPPTGAEYCGLPQEATPFIPFHVEHIIASQHVGESHDDPSGLAYACDRWNEHS